MYRKDTLWDDWLRVGFGKPIYVLSWLGAYLLLGMRTIQIASVPGFL